MTDIKVGDTLWQFDGNRRVYVRAGNGGAAGGPVYAEHFAPHVIAGETKFSWLVNHYSTQTKVNKATLRSAGQSGWGGYQWFTEDGRVAAIWLHENRHRVVKAIEHCSYDTLRVIDALLQNNRAAQEAESVASPPPPKAPGDG